MRILFCLLLLLAIAPQAWAAASSSGQGYTCQTTSVTSSTVPVNIVPSSRMSDFIIHVRTGAAVSALIFPYIGAIPGSPPSNVLERPAGSDLADQVTWATPAGNFGIGEAWGAALASGSTAITVDACWR